MRAEKTMKYLDDKEFLDKLYRYAYKRCSTSYQAEDLCSDIILQILKSIRQSSDIENFYAFAWTVANRVYADFCEKRKQQSDRFISHSYSDDVMNMQRNPVDEYIETVDESLQLKRILHKIAFLSKLYRDVMIMYYLDEMKVAEIAKSLGITQTTVKQRLFSARNTIRKGVEKMDNNYTLKPIKMTFIGTGNPVGNDPRSKAERVLSQNVVYLCKNKARSGKEISEMLHIPMPFIEDELEIQCNGTNGKYGLLRKLDNGKYISNILIFDVSEYKAANSVYEENLEEFCIRLKKYLNANREKILSFPFLNKQTDVRFITWSLISAMVWRLNDAVTQSLKEKYLLDIKILKREFTTVGLAIKNNEVPKMRFYGCDGINASNICGYSKVHFANIYGNRIEKHCECGHNISTDPQLIMTIRAIDGLSVESLSDEEKEIAAKAIECGYIERRDDTLYPKILVFSGEHKKDFYALSSNFHTNIIDIADSIAEKLAALIKSNVPPHLMSEYPMFSMVACINLLNDTIEKCIDSGILNPPRNRLCSEGSWMILWR
jgi:RNA polymerase sigma factor (sigma-70 family)